MNDIVAKLKSLQDTLNQRRQERDQIGAEIQFYLTKLKTEYECATLEEAQGLLTELQSERKNVQDKITADMEQIIQQARAKGLIS